MDFDQFKSDIKTVDAVVRNFEIIGEAAARAWCLTIPLVDIEEHDEVY